MGKVITIGLDIAKSVFQVHGVDGTGAVVIRRRVARDCLNLPCIKPNGRFGTQFISRYLWRACALRESCRLMMIRYPGARSAETGSGGTDP